MHARPATGTLMLECEYVKYMLDILFPVLSFATAGSGAHLGGVAVAIGGAAVLMLLSGTVGSGGVFLQFWVKVDSVERASQTAMA